MTARVRRSGVAASQKADSSADGVAFVDGDYVPVSEARLPLLDWGFTRSDVTYDVVHVWKGSFFRLDDHLDRFARSCDALHLIPGYGREGIREILINCVRRSGLRDAYVEMICTRGTPAPGSRDPRLCRNRFFAFAIPFVWIVAPERQKEGAHLIITDVRRIGPESVDPTVKNFHWGDLTRALFQAFDRGGETALLVDGDGYLAEGPGFNVFRVHEGGVTSPGRTVLEGITRRSVEELCEELGCPFALERISPDKLRDADEVFISSTAGGIMPVTRIDERILGNGRPGPLTMKIRDLYWEKHEQGWHATPVDYDAA
jgi:branched-chain amino acid aminotransferase